MTTTDRTSLDVEEGNEDDSMDSVEPPWIEDFKMAASFYPRSQRTPFFLWWSVKEEIEAFRKGMPIPEFLRFEHLSTTQFEINFNMIKYNMDSYADSQDWYVPRG